MQPHRILLLADQLTEAPFGADANFEGWLAYGAALNEGRALFPSDEQFGQWVDEACVYQLGTHEVRRDERTAAMWAAANPEQFEQARQAGNARTVGGGVPT